MLRSFVFFDGPLGDELSQNVLDQSLLYFQDSYKCGWA